MPASHRRIAAATLAALTLSGCAATPPQPWGSWTDPGLAQNSGLLRGKVLVTCDTFDLLMRAPCQDDLSRALAARGANPVVASSAMPPLSGGSEAQWAADATAAGANAILVMSLTPQATGGGGWGSGVMLGIGAFSGGRGGGGGGIGLSAPIGGGGWGGSTGFAATGRVIDVRSGRMVWSTTFVAGSGGDTGSQVRELQRNVLDAAQASGLL